MYHGKACKKLNWTIPFNLGLHIYIRGCQLSHMLLSSLSEAADVLFIKLKLTYFYYKLNFL